MPMQHDVFQMRDGNHYIMSYEAPTHKLYLDDDDPIWDKVVGVWHYGSGFRDALDKIQEWR